MWIQCFGKHFYILYSYAYRRTGLHSADGHRQTISCVNYGLVNINTPGRRQSKMLILSRNVDKKSLETEFLIAICRHTDDKWQSKTLFLLIFYQRLSIVDCVFDCHLPGVFKASMYMILYWPDKLSLLSLLLVQCLDNGKLIKRVNVC